MTKEWLKYFLSVGIIMAALFTPYWLWSSHWYQFGIGMCLFWLILLALNVVHFGKGATAWEFQIWRFGLRVCHLRGEYWRHRPWRRVQFQFFDHYFWS